jgi:glycosyltransferase involved in cell wall biosynthesis
LSDIEVLVSVNGSLDNTQSIISTQKHFFLEKGIVFTHLSNEINLGFDENIRRCYEGASGEYVWFLSDDDNLFPDAISSIMSELGSKSVAALYFNFKQKPYDFESPLVKNRLEFTTINKDNISCLRNVVEWPKLTSMVVKKVEINLSRQDIVLGFYHVEIFIRVVVKCGSFVSSPKFLAYPDEGYMDHIRFPPYVGNRLNKQLLNFLTELNLADCYESLCVPYVSPLGSSLQALGASYRNKIKIGDMLRAELWGTIFKELRWRNINTSTLWEILKFILSSTVLRRNWKLL